MESILSAFGRVDKDEKLCFQLLLSPVDEKQQESMRKKIADIKDGKKKMTLMSFLSTLFKNLSGNDKDKEEKKQSSKYS
jgi:lipoate-protein ligase A